MTRQIPLFRLVFLSALVVLAFGFGRAASADPNALYGALQQASGGETIRLPKGSYGDVKIAKGFARTVILEGEQGTRFNSVTFEGAKNILIRNITVTGGVLISGGSSGIEVANASIQNSLVVRGASNVRIVGSAITTDSQKAVIIGPNAFDVALIRNDIFQAESDLVQVAGDVKGVLIEGNVIRDPVPLHDKSHPDLIQFFAYEGKTPSNVVIRNNLFFDDASTGIKGAQGIFLGGGHYRDVTIEGNLVFATMTNGIAVSAAVGNVVIKNNTVLGGIIRASDKGAYVGNANGAVVFEGNVARGFYNPESDVDFSRNFFFKDPAAVFSNPQNPSHFSAYFPRKGSPIELGSAFGAQQFLIDLSKAALPGQSGVLSR